MYQGLVQCLRETNSNVRVSRRDFLKTMAWASIMVSPAGQLLGRGIQKEKNIEELYSQDTFVGDAGLEKVFQEQYNKGFTSDLRTRSAPNIAQLPYKQIIEMLGLSKGNPLVMLYPAAGDDITPVLFAHLMRKNSSEGFPINIICTEIDLGMAKRFGNQMDFLASKGVLKYNLSEKVLEETTEINFAVYPLDTNGFDITYKIGLNKDEFFTDEDAKRANIFRELSSPFVPVHYGFVAQMLKKGYKKGRPILLMMQDYDALGPRYSELILKADGSEAGFPLRYIPDKKLVEMEKDQGPLKIEYSGTPSNYVFKVKTDAQSSERPIRDIPGEVIFSRGYTACSCDGCMELWEKLGKEPHMAEYSVLFLIKPGDLDNVSEEELSDRIKKAFRDCKVKVDNSSHIPNAERHSTLLILPEEILAYHHR